MDSSKLTYRLAAALFVAVLAPAVAAAQDTYYWNAADGTDWTAANAWQFNSTSGPAATWVNGSLAVFDSGSGVVPVSTAISAVSLEFASASPLNVTQSPASSGSLTLTGTITMSTSALASITVPLGGVDVSIVRNTPAHTVSALRLGGANTFTGNLIIAGGGSFSDETNTVRIGSAGAIPSTATVQFLARNSALVFDTGVPAKLTLPNNIVLNSSASTANLGNDIRSATATSVTLNGTISGSGDLTYAAEPGGAGSVFNLTGANTYSGNTTVGTGITILVNNPLSGTDTATGTGSVNLSGGRVGGIGRIDGSFLTAGIGLSFGGTGRLAPGDPAVNKGIGQLSVSHDVSWVAMGTYEVELGGLTDTDSNRDQIRTEGFLRIDVANANVNLEVSKFAGFAFAPGQTYTFRIAQANDGITMLGGAGGQFDPNRFDVTSNFGSPGDFSLSYEDGVGTANYLVLTYVAPVPEPGIVLLICAAAAGAAKRGQRRLSALRAAR